MTLTPQIQSLILKSDTWELVEDQIAAILLIEIAKQQELATTAGEDPALWRLRVFQDRANPWEEFLEPDMNLTGRPKDGAPIVHVAFSSASFDPAKGDIVTRQQSDALYNVDVYGCGVAHGDGDGHVPGDEAAGDEAGRAARLVRNILMSSYYVNLGLPGTVGKRWCNSIEFFQLGIQEQAIPNIMACRLTFGVSFNEFAPQYEGQAIEEILATVTRAGTNGEVLLVADYKYT